MRRIKKEKPPLAAFPAGDKMVDQRSTIPREVLGMDLPAGHIHAHHYARSETPPRCHRPVKTKARSNASSASASGGERVHMPMLPQDAPVSEDSLPSSVFPRSGPGRVHPYRPVEEGSSFELVPALATQAPCASGIESLDVTPIPRSNSSPILSKPIQKKDQR